MAREPQSKKRTGLRALAQLSQAPEDEADQAGFPDAPDAAGPLILPSVEPARPSPIEALARVALEAALTPADRRRLRRPAGLAIIVEVPSLGWASAIQHAFTAAFLPASTEVLIRDAETKPSQSAHDAELVARVLAAGTTMLGLSTAPDRFLPPVLIATADLRLRVPPPNGGVLAAAMRRSLPGRVPPLGDDIAAGLDFQAIVACLRPGQPATAAVERLRTAAARFLDRTGDASLPSLEDAVVYGPARDYGLALAQDIADWRAGRLPLDQIHGDCLLWGPPGTGKTFFLRMLARTCGVPLILTSVAEWFAAGTGYLDVVIKQQRAAFARAVAVAPCILGFDEVDALPSREGLAGSLNRDYWMPVVNDFLTLLDGAVGRPPGVVVVGLTNRPDAIDPALLRPGRLERSIEVPAPDAAGLAWVLYWHLGPDLPAADLEGLARMVRGATPADAMGWVRQARRRARQQDRELEIDDLVDEMLPPDFRTGPEIVRAAVHEAGHAVAYLALGAGRLRAVSIVPCVGDGGQTSVGVIGATPDRADLERWVIPILAGRAAEALIVGSASTGAGGSIDSDLGRATRVLGLVHGTFGLGSRLTCIGEAPDFTDPGIAVAVEADLRRLQAEADLLVLRHREAIERLAEALTLKRWVDGHAAAAIAGFGPPGSPQSPTGPTPATDRSDRSSRHEPPGDA